MEHTGSIKITPEKLQTCIDLYKSGKTAKEIAKIIGVSQQTVSRHLKKHGIKPTGHAQSKGVNDHGLDQIDCEEKAYFLGFFLADGCLRQEKDKRGYKDCYRLTFTNSIDDKEIIEYFHNILCPNHKLIEIHNTKGAINRKPQVGIQGSAPNTVDILLNRFKVSPRKTYDNVYSFPGNEIPEQYYRDFLRGFLDGDGSITAKHELRGAFNSEMFMKEYIQVLEKLYNEASKELNIDVPFTYSFKKIQGKTTTYGTVVVNMGKARIPIYKKLFYENANLYLHRKFQKLEI